MWHSVVLRVGKRWHVCRHHTKIAAPKMSHINWLFPWLMRQTKLTEIQEQWIKDTFVDIHGSDACHPWCHWIDSKACNLPHQHSKHLAQIVRQFGPCVHSSCMKERVSPSGQINWLCALTQSWSHTTISNCARSWDVFCWLSWHNPEMRDSAISSSWHTICSVSLADKVFPPFEKVSCCSVLSNWMLHQTRNTLNLAMLLLQRLSQPQQQTPTPTTVKTQDEWSALQRSHLT